MKTTDEQLRDRYPGMAKKADYSRSKTAAIKLKCRECMGGNAKDVKDCTSYSCFLWPYRNGKPQERPEGFVPSEEEYQAKTKVDDATLERLKRGRRVKGDT